MILTTINGAESIDISPSPKQTQLVDYSPMRGSEQLDIFRSKKKAPMQTMAK